MPTEQARLLAIHHIVHEYANFVSSAEMVLTGKDVDGKHFKPPINTHVSHAFYLNCRKLADFFQTRTGAKDDVLAKHFVSGFTAKLPVCDEWRTAINRQLAHISYRRDVDSREITRDAQQALYDELRGIWREFRSQLPQSYVAEFTRQLRQRKEPYLNGAPSEFESYDLD